jgi:hypothetical protein
MYVIIVFTENAAMKVWQNKSYTSDVVSLKIPQWENSCIDMKYYKEWKVGQLYRGVWIHQHATCRDGVLKQVFVESFETQKCFSKIF